jgi:hypothetical protein
LPPGRTVNWIEAAITATPSIRLRNIRTCTRADCGYRLVRETRFRRNRSVRQSRPGGKDALSSRLAIRQGQRQAVSYVQLNGEHEGLVVIAIEVRG